VTTVPQKAQKQEFREIRPQLFDKSGFLFPYRQAIKRNFLVVKDDM
jgi:hypothetical protein